MPKDPEYDLAAEIDDTTIEGYMLKDGIDPDAARKEYLDKIAKGLGAVPKGRVPARSGNIGAVETLAAVQALKAEDEAKK